MQRILIRKMCTTVIRHVTILKGLPGLPSTGYVYFGTEKINTRIEALEQSRKLATEVNSLDKDVKLGYGQGLSGSRV